MAMCIKWSQNDLLTCTVWAIALPERACIVLRSPLSYCLHMAQAGICQQHYGYDHWQMLHIPYKLHADDTFLYVYRASAANEFNKHNYLHNIITLITALIK